MGLQMLGKLKLQEPFQPQWADLPLWLNGRGVTTGPIHWAGGAYEVTADFISHRVGCATSWGFAGNFELGPMSVAQFATSFFDLLRKAGVNVSIKLKPQEVPDPINFDQDTQQRPYESALVNTWWRILLSTQRVLKVYHGRFKGKTQPIGLMWGTLDIRDARYSGKLASPGVKADYIRRNAMNEEMIEAGLDAFWVRRFGSLQVLGEEFDGGLRILHEATAGAIGKLGIPGGEIFPTLGKVFGVWQVSLRKALTGREYE